MYVPRPFAVDSAEAGELLGEVVVGQLITATEAGLMATLLPWVIDLDAGVLIGHMARANPQWQTPWLGEAMVIAQGPDGYVSPSWYASKAEHGRVVPTWNYVAVQVHGDLVIHDDLIWVDAAVRRLTERHEEIRLNPWSVSDAPPDYIEAQERGVVGIEVQIRRIEAAVKMSQNKSSADAQGVIAGFSADGNDRVSSLVSQVTDEGPSH